MTLCPETDSLRRMLSGELTEAEATDVESHVGVCPRCQAAVEAMLGTWDAQPDAGVTAPSYLQRLSPATTAELPPQPQAPPPELTGYEILGELGRGGMGVVYLARQVSLERLAAVKLMLGGSHAGWQARARFQAEAKVVARLQHPNIVLIYSVGEHDGLPYLEMEYLAGGSLAAKLKGMPMRPDEAARLVEPLALGMAEAHRVGILHRDLKPGNVLLAADGTPKVADFGLAKLLGDDSGVTQSGAIMGSPSYMAPEQAEGRFAAIGPPTDVYALGAILYETLTGRPPFRGATAVETLQQVRSVDPIPPSRLATNLPRDLETIALKCLEKDHSRRYPTARELADDLRRYLDDRPIRARPAGRLERSWKWAKRRPAVASLSALSILATALLIGLGAYFNTRLIRTNADLTQALERARQAEREAAESAKSSAEQRDLALKTLNTLVFEVQRKLGREPRTRPLQQALLEEAIKGLSAQAKTTRTSAPDASRAAAHYKLALVFLGLGRHDECREEGEQAAEVAEALIASGKADGKVRELAGRARGHLGDELLSADKPDAAIEQYARGLRHVEGVSPSDPDAALLRLGEIDLIDRLLGAHVWKRAAESTRDLADRLERLAISELARSPDDPEVRHAVNNALQGLAAHADQLADYPRAFDYYRRAIDLGRRRVADAPGELRARMSLQQNLGNMAILLNQRGDKEGALAPLRESLGLLDAMHRDDPDNPRLSLEIANSRSNLAFMLLELARFEEAVREYRASLEILARPEVAKSLDANVGFQMAPRIKRWLALCEAGAIVLDDPGPARKLPPDQAIFLLLHRARTLADRKDAARLAETAAMLREVPAEDPKDRLELAAACLACAGLLEAASRPEDARICRASARDILTEALAMKPTNLAELLARPPLAPLLQDPELSKLLPR